MQSSVGACTYIIILSKVVFAFAHNSCPYHTRINKSLVLEWPTFTDVYSFYCLLQLVTPTFLIKHAAQRNTSSSTQCRAHLNKHFKTVFSPVSYFCVVVEAPLQPQCRRDILLIFAIISENSTDPSFRFSQVLTSYIFAVRFVSCLLCCCRV